MNKKYGVLALLVLLLTSVIPFTTAHSDNYEIDEVYVNDINVNNGVVYAERGKTTEVEVFLYGEGNATEVKVKAWIGGYEHDDVEDVTAEFEVEEGVFYKKTLRLEIPEDMDPGEEYSLHVEVYDDQDFERLDPPATLRIREGKHALNIYDVIFNPGLEVQAGETLGVEVRVENLGYEEEDDIKVILEIPALGLSTSSYIDELVPEDEEDEDDDEESSASKNLFLNVPSNTRSGVYNAVVKVEYDRGHEEITEEYNVVITSGVSAADLDVEAQETTLSAEAGDTVVYTVMLRNLGDASVRYNFDVGTISWGTVEVEPSDIRLDEDESAEVYVFVTPNLGVTGTKSFNLYIMDGDVQVETVSLRTDIESDGGPASSQITSFRQGLEIGFAILLVILVILGIILAVKKIGKPSEIEEPVIEEEDQTYY